MWCDFKGTQKGRISFFTQGSQVWGKGNSLETQVLTGLPWLHVSWNNTKLKFKNLYFCLQIQSDFVSCFAMCHVCQELMQKCLSLENLGLYQLFHYFVLGPHLVVFKAYFWLCPEKLLLVVLWWSCVMPGIEPISIVQGNTLLTHYTIALAPPPIILQMLPGKLYLILIWRWYF